MREQLISFETAKLAKEKGFHIYTGKAWIKKKGEDLFFTPSFAGRAGGVVYHAPTQSLLQKWLRVVHSIHIVLVPQRHNNNIRCIIHIINLCDNVSSSDNISKRTEKSYEDALEEALIESLNIIK